MEAKDVSLLDILNEDNKIEFIIPFFQRSYVWGKENWESILEDLRTNENHFLGSLILKYDSKNRYQADVIDGQQRLTTLSILVKALYDISDEATKKHYFASFKSVLFTEDSFFSSTGIKTIYKPRITHSKFDKDAFEKVIGKVLMDENGNQFMSSISQEEVEQINEETSHAILCCYKFFVRILKKEYSLEEIFNLMQLLSTNEKHFLVRIKLSENDDEQNIFDTVNNSGKKLTTADIIKNKLFKKALDLVGSGNEDFVYQLYDKEWESLFYKDEDFFKFWNDERQTGRVRRTNMEIFLYCVAIIKNMYVPSVDNLEKLDVPYENKLEEFKTYDKIERFITEIINYGTSYIELFKDIDTQQSYKKEDENYYLKRLLLVSRELEVSTFSPFILLIYSSDLSNYEKNDRYFSLEKMLIKNVLVGESTKNYNKNCVELIKDYESYKRVLFNPQKYINFDNENCLYKLKNKQAILILFLLELEQINKKNDVQSLEYIYSLEHIMPRDWQKNWSFSNVKPVDSLGALITDSLMAENNRKRSINSLGNMTLITKNFNSSLKNKSFEEKMNGNKKHDGYTKHSSLMITKKIIEEYNAGKTIWNEQRIFDRLNYLIIDIKNIWFN